MKKAIADRAADKEGDAENALALNEYVASSDKKAAMPNISLSFVG